MSGQRRAVYRALIGGYEELREEPVAHESDVPFICITDDPDLTSETWTIVHTEPRFARDLTRSARHIKIMGHSCLEEYEETLWLDNTVELLARPEDILDEWLADSDVAAPLHTFRQSIHAEAEAILDDGLDDHARVYEQTAHYLRSDASLLEQNPHWTGILARRRTPAVDAAMLAWWENVLRYSRRDQLSFLPVMRAHGVRLGSIPLDNLASRLHNWPRARGRLTHRQGSGSRDALRPAAGRIGQLEQALDAATHELANIVSQREALVSGLEQERTGFLEENQRLAGEVNEARAELARAQGTVQSLRRRVDRQDRKLKGLRRTLRRVRRAKLSLEAQQPRRRLPWPVTRSSPGRRG